MEQDQIRVKMMTETSEARTKEDVDVKLWLHEAEKDGLNWQEGESSKTVQENHRAESDKEDRLHQ